MDRASPRSGLPEYVISCHPVTEKQEYRRGLGRLTCFFFTRVIKNRILTRIRGQDDRPPMKELPARVTRAGSARPFGRQTLLRPDAGTGHLTIGRRT